MVNDVIGKLENKFGQESTLVTSQGKTVEYLRMTKSTILLAENGNSSSSKWTRHLNIRYFFVTDKARRVR